MTSFIVISRSKDQRQRYATDYCHELGINKYDISVIEKNSDSKKNIQSIGIDEIKSLHKSIFLKPLNSKVKAVILEDAHLMTIEAQNALLKVLEEPPEHTIIILGVNSSDSLLPTVLSRCQIIELPSSNVSLSVAEKAEFEQIISNLFMMRVGERLKKAEELGQDKEEALIWIGKLILVMREKLLDDKSQNTDILPVIRSFQDLHTLLSATNVNPRFAIEQTLLSL